MNHIPGFSELSTNLIKQPELFNEISLGVFSYQYNNNKIYRSFADLLGRNPANISGVAEFPFLPVQFFKSYEITCFDPGLAAKVYTSSGTTGQQPSRHFVKQYEDYETSFLRSFRLFYGPETDYVIFGLLPGYLEREGSSLIDMVSSLIRNSGNDEGGFYLHNHGELISAISHLREQGRKCLLIGVTYALLDLASKGPFAWDHVTVMETGGMKGHRKELVRSELHNTLSTAFGVSSIHSEYGMTELLSQAYATASGLFRCPPWMKVVIRESHDPLAVAATGKTGGINIIDLANLHSCSFIATEDLGKVHSNGEFEVLGRFDNSEIRGCNLMVS